jgi:hypothetical protein
MCRPARAKNHAAEPCLVRGKRLIKIVRHTPVFASPVRASSKGWAAGNLHSVADSPQRIPPLNTTGMALSAHRPTQGDNPDISHVTALMAAAKA